MQFYICKCAGLVLEYGLVQNLTRLLIILTGSIKKMTGTVKVLTWLTKNNNPSKRLEGIGPNFDQSGQHFDQFVWRPCLKFDQTRQQRRHGTMTILYEKTRQCGIIMIAYMPAASIHLFLLFHKMGFPNLGQSTFSVFSMQREIFKIGLIYMFSIYTLPSNTMLFFIL